MKTATLLFALLPTVVLAQTQAVDIQQIFKTTKSWNDANLPGFSNGPTEFKVVKFKIAPGAKTLIHLHPLNGVGYVLSGELTMYTTDDPQGSFTDKTKVKNITLAAGKSWAETVNTWHYGENKGAKDVEFIVVFAGTEGVPATLSLGTMPPSL